MTENDEFDLLDFLPYLLNQAADATSLEFQRYYRSHYGMLRTEWRVLFHLGSYGAMTATDICSRARIHKTKVSRAVAALQDKRFLTRQEMPQDRRNAQLALTRAGQSAFDDLRDEAARSQNRMLKNITAQDREVLRRCLRQIAGCDQARRPLALSK